MEAFGGSNLQMGHDFQVKTFEETAELDTLPMSLVHFHVIIEQAMWMKSSKISYFFGCVFCFWRLICNLTAANFISGFLLVKGTQTRYQILVWVSSMHKRPHQNGKLIKQKGIGVSVLELITKAQSRVIKLLECAIESNQIIPLIPFNLINEKWWCGFFITFSGHMALMCAYSLPNQKKIKI